MHRLLPALLVLALSACDYEAPVDTDEPYLAPPRISGTVLVDGLEAPARDPRQARECAESLGEDAAGPGADPAEDAHAERQEEASVRLAEPVRPDDEGGGVSG